MNDSEKHDHTPGRPEDIEAVPVRHPVRWIAAALIVLFAASFVVAAINNPRYQWGQIGHFLFDSRVLHGVVATIYLTVLVMLIGVVLGIVLAVMRLSPNPVVKGAAWLYIYVFRGTPVLLQIVFWYNIAALYPKIGLGIPFGPDLVHLDGNTLITVLVASLLGLGLNEGAYMAEIVRAGILSVGEGQTEAASSLGMSRIQVLRHIVLPQAMKVIVPPTGNETISMLKSTSLASFVTFAELYYEQGQISAANYEVIPLLIVASIWYLVMTTVLYVIQYFIERRFGRGVSRAAQAGMRARWLGMGRGNLGGFGR